MTWTSVEVAQDAASTLDIVGGHFEGAAEIVISFPFTVLDAEDAVYARFGSTIRATGGAVFVGGDGNFSPDGFGIDSDDPQSVFLDPSVTATTRPGNSTVRTQLPAVTTDPAIRGSAFTVRAFGPTNAVMTVIASLPSPTAPFDLRFGRVVVDPAANVVVGTGRVGPNRLWSTQVSVPLGLPESLTLIWQAVSLETPGTFKISAPTAAVVR